MLMNNKLHNELDLESNYRNHPHLRAVKLNVTESELDALLWFRRELEDGDLYDPWDPTTLSVPIPERGFDIGETLAVGCFCGTVACIGGWMALRMGLGEADSDTDRSFISMWVINRCDLDGKPVRSEALTKLFIPMDYDISPLHYRGKVNAIKAINRFLLGETSPWAIWAA